MFLCILTFFRSFRYVYYVDVVITTCTVTSETSCASVDLISACLLLMHSVSIKIGRIRSKHDL